MPPLTYAIGDIHGRLDLLDQALALVEADAGDRGVAAKVVFTGDYMDRGPASCGVVDRLLAGPSREGDSFLCLRGNHDDLFARAATHGRDVPDWAWQLFFHTIKSYGLDRDRDWRSDDRLKRHAAFLAGLPLTHDDGRHLFVHAGLRPGIPLAEQTEWDLLWIRDEFLHYEGLLPRRVVHGHTIVGDQPEVRPHRVSIDTGAYRSGILTIAVLDGREPAFLQALGEPDRAAIAREILLVEHIAGRPVTPVIQQTLEAFVAGAIDAPEMERRVRRAA